MKKVRAAQREYHVNTLKGNLILINIYFIVGRAEAQENRNFIITKLCDDIIEIMRVLQLKVDDEYDLEDPCNLMRKNRHRLLEKMKLAKDWLNNPDSDPNGLGK